MGDYLETGVTNVRQSGHKAVAVAADFQSKSQKCSF